MSSDAPTQTRNSAVFPTLTRPWSAVSCRVLWFSWFTAPTMRRASRVI